MYTGGVFKTKTSSSFGSGENNHNNITYEQINVNVHAKYVHKCHNRCRNISSREKTKVLEWDGEEAN